MSILKVLKVVKEVCSFFWLSEFEHWGQHLEEFSWTHQGDVDVVGVSDWCLNWPKNILIILIGKKKSFYNVWMFLLCKTILENPFTHVQSRINWGTHCRWALTLDRVSGPSDLQSFGLLVGPKGPYTNVDSTD